MLAFAHLCAPASLRCLYTLHAATGQPAQGPGGLPWPEVLQLLRAAPQQKRPGQVQQAHDLPGKTGYGKFRGLIDMAHINILITLLKQYSLLSLVVTYIDASNIEKIKMNTYQRNRVLNLASIFLHCHASPLLLHCKRKQ